MGGSRILFGLVVEGDSGIHVQLIDRRCAVFAYCVPRASKLATVCTCHTDLDGASGLCTITPVELISPTKSS